MTAENRRKDLLNLVNQYEEHLQKVIHIDDRFDLNRLPDIIKQTVQVITTTSPGFSNTAALAAASHVMSHMLSQPRPVIDDLTVSRDKVPTNNYFIILSSSGSGKSKSVKTLNKAYQPAKELVDSKRKEAMERKAKAQALAALQEEHPDYTVDNVTDAMAAPYMEELPRTTISADSTRGGSATLLARIQKEELSAVALIIDELGMSLESGTTINEMMKLLTELFDVGTAEAPEYKGAESKEQSLSDIYINMLAHSSPTIVYSNKVVKDKLTSLFKTAFARRTFFISPDVDESVENNQVATTIEEDRQLTDTRRATTSKLLPQVSSSMTEAIYRLLSNRDNLTITLSPEAQELYTDYYNYCSKKAELLLEDSIQQTELFGRAFKLVRLAAIWQLAQQSSVITYDTLASTIYFVEYISKYLDKFVMLTTAKPYEILASYFLDGTKSISLDETIRLGIVNKVTPTFQEILDPLNSKLAKQGVAHYDKDLKSFIYNKFDKVEPEELTTCSFTMSYKLVPDLPTKAGREVHLANFDRFRDDLCYSNIVNLLSRNSIFNTFQYAAGSTTTNPDVLLDMYRSNKSIISKSNLVIIDIDQSSVPLESVHDFLAEYQHIISTSSDVTNKYKFRIILPVNVELDGANSQEYAYVVRRVCADLLLTPDPKSYCPSQAWYGYEGAEVTLTDEGKLYDVTEYLTEFAKDEKKVQSASTITKQRSPKARKAHIDKLMDSIDKVFEYAILAKPGEGSLMLARAAMHCADEGCTAEEMETIIRYINDCWDVPMNESRLMSTIVTPISSRCKQ